MPTPPRRKLATINGFDICQPTSGGKAGYGCNKTGSIQVFKPINNEWMTRVANFRFKIDDSESRETALQKAKDYANAHDSNS